MAQLIRKFSVFSNGSIKDESVATYSGWRCLHPAEGGYQSSPSNPIIRPSVDAPPIDFNEPMQWLVYNINKRHNPYWTGDRQRSLFWTDRAFANEQGYDIPNDPRADFINKRNINSDPPKLMKAIICGGSFYRGDVVGNELVCKPGIHAIDATKTIPSVETVLANQWYFTATTGGYETVNNFPQGKQPDGSVLPVLMPYFLKEPTPYPLAWFEKWERSYLPNPLAFYK